MARQLHKEEGYLVQKTAWECVTNMSCKISLLGISMTPVIKCKIWYVNESFFNFSPNWF